MAADGRQKGGVKIAGETQQKGGEIQGRALGNMRAGYPLEAPTEDFLKQTETVPGEAISGGLFGDQGNNFSVQPGWISGGTRPGWKIEVREVWTSGSRRRG